MKKTVRSLVFFLFLAFSLPAASEVPPQAAAGLPEGVPVIVMTHATLSQVKNIVEMYEKDVLPLKSLVLLGIYHEDELANKEQAQAYLDAFTYVEKNAISWVRFRKITGRVGIDGLFRENLWTAQFREIFAAASGFIFTGGEDIPPAVYGQETSLLTEPWTPARSLYEVSLLFHLLGSGRNPSFAPLLGGRKDFPVLAICLGLQSLNVAAGGDLIQDIPSEVYGQKTVEAVLASAPDQIHSGVYLEKLFPNDEDLLYPFHRIRLGGDSVIVGRMGISARATPFVATSHHQAIGKLGAGLRVTATSMDGKIIEAVEHERFANVLGIQFHPERYTLYRKGLFLYRQPGAPKDFNPLAFLKTNPPTYAFHLAIWKWFAEAVLTQTRLGIR